MGNSVLLLLNARKSTSRAAQEVELKKRALLNIIEQAKRESTTSYLTAL